jgi:hypothetical protein
MKQVSTTTQSTVAAGGAAYLGLAPHLTNVTMFKLDLDLLPPDVAESVASLLTTGYTGIVMLAVGAFGVVLARLNRARAGVE